MLSPSDVWRADLNGINADYSLQVEELVETLLISIQREHRAQVDELHADHAREVQELQTQNEQLNEQLTSTVRMYNSLISDLKAELSDARKQAEDADRRRASDIKQLTAQNSLDDDQLKRTLDEYKGMIKDLKQQLDAAKRRDNDKDTVHQRQRLILIQTNDHLQAELDSLRRQVEDQKQQQQQQQQQEAADGPDASTGSSLQNNSRDD